MQFINGDKVRIKNLL